MSRIVRINREAEQDLEDIAYYIAVESPSASDRLVDEFHRVFGLLAEHPGIGRARPELSARLYSFVVGNYLVFYRFTTTILTITRVVHGSRELKGIFRRN